MLPGISTACFYPQYTEEALASILHYSISAVEVFFNCAAEVEPAFLKELRRMADAAGTQIRSVHPYTCGMEPMYFFSDYSRRFDEGAELYKRYYHAANLLGAEYVVFHGAMRHQQMPWEEYFRRFSIIQSHAKEQGVLIAQENVDRCMSRTPEFFAAMGAALPDTPFVLDTKQAVRANRDINLFLESMGQNLAHIHISDHNDEESCLIPGTGVLNIGEMLFKAAGNGFDGAVVVELYRENFDTIVDIIAGYQHLCTVISTFRKTAQTS